MAVTYRINPDERVVYLDIDAGPSFEEWRDAMQTLLSDPAFKTGFDFLSSRGPDAGPPSAEFTQKAAAFYRDYQSRFGRCRWASVVAGDATTYDTIRKLAIMSEGTDIQVMVFRDTEEARRWLMGFRN
jgi:hypothetical protein